MASFAYEPEFDCEREPILEAATRIIVMQSPSAPTAGIAKEAGVANRSLFTYFETKTDLFNQLYLELKTEMASAAMKDLPTRAEPREQLLHLWQHWMNWAVSYPAKRRALAQLGVSEEIKLETRAAAHKTMAGVAGLVNSVAEATIDFMTQDPTHARKYCKEGFEALWRVVA